MSERKSTDYEERVSPYLLRPARTYEEYLRDRAIADRLEKQLADRNADPVDATGEGAPANTGGPAWKKPNASADPALVVPQRPIARKADSGDPANNQT